MNKPVICLTGASGIIGSILSAALSKEYNLRLFDLKASSQDIIKVHFSKKEEVSGIFNDSELLIHLAADPRPNAPDESIIKNNFIATSNVFSEAQKAGIKKIIYASSNCVHQGSIIEAFHKRIGSLRTLIPANAPLSPKCLYAESKVFGENIGKHLSFSGIEFIAMRIGWVFKSDVIPAAVDIRSEFFQSIYCSNFDLIEAFKKALEVKTDFMAVYVVSNNDRGVFDMTATNTNLGFYPKNNAGDFIREARK